MWLEKYSGPDSPVRPELGADDPLAGSHGAVLSIPLTGARIFTASVKSAYEYEMESARLTAQRARSLLLTAWLATRLGWEFQRDGIARRG